MPPADPARIDAGFNRSVDNFHPLELFPFFRRWKCSPARDVLYTFIWNCGFAVVFWMIGSMFTGGLRLSSLQQSLLIANAIGYTLHAIFIVTSTLGLDRWARANGPVVTTAYYTAVSMVGVMIGTVVVALATNPSAMAWVFHPRTLGTMGMTSGIISGVIAVVFFSREREARAEAAAARDRERLERVQREATLANLRALQAQIEPHFLFNTLANVASLVDADPAKAKRMLEGFIRFLRASLAATRTESTTLGADAELIRSFLDVLQVRMGERLAYRIEVPDELSGFEIPPLLVQPIVENAIRHGLEPKVEGGEVVLSARREGTGVRIEVADTGVGFGAATQGGLGLSNLRSRLKALYGERATLGIHDNDPVGTRVQLTIPA